jgi:tRNA pseudouridine38-40 synthase
VSIVRAKLLISYEGTDFHGWARQNGKRTVEEVLLNALGQIVRRSITMTVAGRTDAGVHALGQVAHVDIPVDAWERLPRRSHFEPASALVRRLNGIIPKDVRVVDAQVVSEEFNARFSAIWRRYRYRIADHHDVKNPLERHRTLWHIRKLDEVRMNDAATLLLGEHDFAAYCRPKRGGTSIRELQMFQWHRDGEGVLVGDVRADAFCHNMVRALVGACIAVGEGKHEPEFVRDVLDSGQRNPRLSVVAPHGLTLMEVGYPPEEQWGERARLTRALRTPSRAD